MAVDLAAAASGRRRPPRLAVATKPSRRVARVAVLLLAVGDAGAAAYGAASSLAAQSDVDSRLPIQVGT